MNSLLPTHFDAFMSAATHMAYLEHFPRRRLQPNLITHITTKYGAQLITYEFSSCVSLSASVKETPRKKSHRLLCLPTILDDNLWSAGNSRTCYLGYRLTPLYQCGEIAIWHWKNTHMVVHFLSLVFSP